MTPYQVIEHWDFTRTRESFNQVIGAWQPVRGGYNLEIRVPARLVGSHLGLLVHDVDTPDVLVESVGTAGPQTATRPGRLLRTSAQLEARIEDLRLPLGRRVWVAVNRGGIRSTSYTPGCCLPRTRTSPTIWPARRACADRK